MTKIKKLTIILIVAICSALCSGYDMPYADNCGVYDDYGIFTDDELDSLNELVKNTADEINMYVAVYISDMDLNEFQIETFADEAYESLFGENTDGVLYYMDLSGGYSAYDYISTSGMATLVYTDETNDGSDNRIDKMFDSIFNYLPSSNEPVFSEDLERGIQEICNQLEKYAQMGAKSNYYCYDSADGKYIYEKNGVAVVSSRKPLSAILNPSIMLLGLCIGLIVAVTMYIIIKSSYKFKTSCDSSVYVSKDETRFTLKDDRFIRQYTTKTKIQSSSSGGGSHHHGGSHGGGSHGGGGRHR